MLLVKSQQVVDRKSQLGLPGRPGGPGGDGQVLGWAIIGLKDRMTKLQ